MYKNLEEVLEQLDKSGVYDDCKNKVGLAIPLMFLAS
jgi:hypothetical protein